MDAIVGLGPVLQEQRLYNETRRIVRLHTPRFPEESSAGFQTKMCV